MLENLVLNKMRGIHNFAVHTTNQICGIYNPEVHTTNCASIFFIKTVDGIVKQNNTITVRSTLFLIIHY